MHHRTEERRPGRGDGPLLTCATVRRSPPPYSRHPAGVEPPPRRQSTALPVKEPAMSMIRDLRAVVRPHRRRSTYDGSLTEPTPSAVVDCAVYRDGKRVGDSCSPREAAHRVRLANSEPGEAGSFVWIGLHEPTEAEFEGI